MGKNRSRGCRKRHLQRCYRDGGVLDALVKVVFVSRRRGITVEQGRRIALGRINRGIIKCASREGGIVLEVGNETLAGYNRGGKT